MSKVLAFFYVHLASGSKSVAASAPSNYVHLASGSKSVAASAPSLFARLCVSLLLLISAFARAESAPVVAAAAADFVAKARELKLSERDEWHRLLHDRKSLMGHWTSEASGQNFFVAPDGRKNPAAELEATLAGFFSTEKRKLEGRNVPAQSVRCQFPARFEWLDQELHFSNLFPHQDCKEWEEFRDRVAAKSVTIVFSSFYSGNPGSTFGHSLLRLNKSNGADGSEHHQLLDYGVNYAAEQTVSNPLLYSLYGLIGVFHGSFTNIPYYYKVREYGDFESRDLWEYDLDLTPAEVARVIEHLWELGTTYFDYYFLSANCSYHMMTLIEAAAPRTHLVERAPFYVIPTDTVKAFFADHLVRKTHFRASLYSQFNARRARLSRDEENELLKLVKSDRSQAHPSVLLPPEMLIPDSRARIADAYMDYVDLQYAKEIYKKEEAYTAPKDALLLARSRLPMTPPLEFLTTPVANPNDGHPSARMMLIRSENQNRGGATDFEIRSALHDLIDPPNGLPDADIDFFRLDLRLWDRPQTLQIQNAVLFGVGTYRPLDDYTRKSSWRGKIGLQRVDDARCDNCTAGGAWGGYGYSVNVHFGFETLTYALIDAEGFTSPGFVADKFTLRGGPTLGLRTRFSDALGLLTEAHYFWTLSQPHFEDYQIDSHLRLVPTGSLWGVDLHGIWKTQSREVALGILHYF